jgi:D-glycero-alpha-D-manno-heptose-7-phosphate kinase
LILGRSPLRISFAGGGTDLEEYHNKFDGYALTFTINKFTHVIAKLRDDDKFQGFSPDFASHHPPKSYRKIEPVQGHEIVVNTLKQMHFRRGIDIFFSSDVAPGSGLGASSSLTSNLVNIICNIQRKNWSKNKIAMKAYDIGHNVLKWNVGKQDEFSSVFGGLNLLKFTKTKVSVEEIHLNKSTLQELKNNSMLFYIGKRKFSSDKILRKIDEGISCGNTKTIKALHNAKKLALELRDALKQNNLAQFGEIISKGWEEKKKFTNQVSDKYIDSIVAAAKRSGAEGIKIPGAGGGGYMYIYAPISLHPKIIRNLKKFNVLKSNFEYRHGGVFTIDTNSL